MNDIMLTRHVGRLTNTGTRVVVIYRVLPEDSEHCLVVEADRLPEMYADNLNSLVKTTQAQSTTELYEVLHRNTFGDGAPCLLALHSAGYLRKVPVSLIEMLPLPGHSVPLATVNEQIDGGSIKVTQPPAAASEVASPRAPETSPKKEADQLIKEAIALENKAYDLREMAYVLDPSKRPGVGRKPLTSEEKEVRKQRKNAKRRESYKITGK